VRNFHYAGNPETRPVVCRRHIREVPNSLSGFEV